MLKTSMEIYPSVSSQQLILSLDIAKDIGDIVSDGSELSAHVDSFVKY